MDRPKQGGAGPDKDITSDCRMPFPEMFSGAAESDVVEQHTVVPDLSSLTDHNPRAMIDKDTIADSGAGVDLQPSEEAGQLRKQPRKERDPCLVQQVIKAMKSKGMESRIQQEFNIPSGRIVTVNCFDVFMNA